MERIFRTVTITGTWDEVGDVFCFMRENRIAYKIDRRGVLNEDKHPCCCGCKCSLSQKIQLLYSSRR